MSREKHALTQRFQILRNAISPCRVLADIGSDHGKLCIAALQGGACEYAIASDISVLSLNKARELAKKLGYDDRMDFRVGDGLRVLDEKEADVIVIAGMGGRLIAELLQAAPQCVQQADRLLLQPMQQSADLRTYLRRQGYGITAEWMVFENRRFCEVIQISTRDCAAYPDDLDADMLDHVGPLLWRERSPVLRDKLAWEMAVMEKKLREIRKNQTEHACQSEKEMVARLQKWQAMLAQYDQ